MVDDARERCEALAAAVIGAMVEVLPVHEGCEVSIQPRQRFEGIVA